MKTHKRKTHLGLLVWVFLLMSGSTIWLKFTLQGDKSGHPSSMPLWMRDYDGVPVIENVTLDIDYADCLYDDPSTDADASLTDQGACGLDNAQVSVRARIHGVHENMDGLYLVILASKDFKSWWQANDIFMPRDMFHMNATSLKPSQLRKLQDYFDNAALNADVQPAGDVDSVKVTDLVEPMKEMFSGVGAIDIDDETVSGELMDQKNGSCAAPCYVVFYEFLAAYEALRARYTPVAEVQTKACLGRPGFTYLTACVTSGVSSDKKYGEKCSGPPCKGVSGPPFNGCRAIATSCGATCESNAVEPVDREDSDPKRYCDAFTAEIDKYEIEVFYLRTLRMDMGAALFAIMYIIGLGSLFQMYMPGVGQRQAQRPTWDKLRDAVIFGQVTTLTHEWRVMVKQRKKNRDAQTAKLILERKKQMRADRQAEQQRLKTVEHEMTSLAGGSAKDKAEKSPGFSRFSSLPKMGRRTSKLDAGESESGNTESAAGLSGIDASRRDTRDPVSEGDGGNVIEMDALDNMLDTSFGVEDELLLLTEGNVRQNVRGSFRPQQLSTCSQITSLTDSTPRTEEPKGNLRALGAAEQSPLGTRASGKGGMINAPEVSADEEDHRSLTASSQEHVPNGMTTVMFSISAGEGRNIVTRNLIGKIAANLSLMTTLPQADMPLQFIDAFADEGHRLGAYYLMRAISIAFYEAMSRPVALQIARNWLEAMNSHESASNVDVDLFKLLPEAVQKRSEILFVQFFHKVFPVLNALTVPVDFLFDKVLAMPLLADAAHRDALTMLSEKLSGGKGKFQHRVERLLASEEFLADFNERFKIKDRKAGGMIVKQVLASFSHSGQAQDGAQSKTMRDLLVERLDKEGERDATLFSTQQLSIFHPAFISAFGAILFECEGTVKKSLDSSVPLDAAAYMSTMLRLDKADPLGCNAYYDLRAVLSLEEKARLVQATQKRQLCYDHIAQVAHPRCGVVVLYLARGKPDKWQPWTKSRHRRVIKPGVWCARKPRDGSIEAFWHARRQIALCESIEGPGHMDFDEDGTERFWQEASAVAYFYEDKDADISVVEGSQRVNLNDIQLLNTHLGKAGGLNFGLEALLMTEGVVHPCSTHPMIFGIIDARHACDHRFWLNVLPAFHELHGNNEVKFDPEIMLCQVPHSYIGMEHATDKLDMRNDFLFTGMAIVRDRCYGMTSCGTGGIWAITSPVDADQFFYGRTMIEDTSSSHEKFLIGGRSVYLAPFRGTNRQLMRAVPKVSANYLEALERWDTGAIQLFVSQGVLSRWFWTCVFCLLMLHASILAPSMTRSTASFWKMLQNPFDPDHWIAGVVYVYSASVLGCIFFTVVFLSYSSPRTLNYLLRYLILLFNTTYPFNSIASVFWLVIPPWLCLSGEFPFALNAVAAITGSLILKFIEFMIIMKIKKDSEMQGAGLDETSIFRSQQMDKVTVPIKMRAVVKGLQTGWKDIHDKVDNSWWESFGAAKAQQWVQIWLLSINFFMILSLIVGPIRLIVAAVKGNNAVVDVALPVCFGMVQAVLNVWITYDPLMYIMKGNAPKLSLRWLEVAVLIGMAIVTFAVIQANEQ